MSRKKLSPEVEIMNLFATLNEDGKRIVVDWVKSQMATPRKAATKKTEKTPKPKVVTLPDVPEEFKHGASA